MERDHINWKKRTVLFITAQLITLFGSMLVQMAIVWHVAFTTSSGSLVTAITLCSFVPQMLISPFAGVWADRYSRKTLILLADGAIALATLLLALLLRQNSFGTAALVSILLVSFIRGLGAGVQTPAVNAVIPLLVPQEQLMRVNSINGSLQAMIQLAAPAAAGIVMSLGTISDLLLIDVVTAAVGMGLLLLLPISRAVAPTTENHESMGEEIKKGIRGATANPWLKKTFLVYGLTIFLSVPAGFLSVLMVERLFGGSYLYVTINEMVGFFGMAAGGAVLAVWGGFGNRLRTMALGLFASGLFSLALGVTQSFPLFVGLMFGISAAIPLGSTSMMTIIQEQSDPELQGRMFSLLNMMFSGFMPLGMILFGPLADFFSIQSLAALCGAGMLVVAVWALKLPRNSDLLKKS